MEHLKAMLAEKERLINVLMKNQGVKEVNFPNKTPKKGDVFSEQSVMPECWYLGGKCW